MSLPTPAVDRLFDRLMATYGQQWVRLWEGVDPMAVKTLWAYELASFDGRLDCIAWALENLPARCPNAIEFKLLCRQAPAKPEKLLPELKADPERMKAELEKLTPMRKSMTSSHGMKDWAYRLKAHHDAGAKLSPNQIRCYQDAIGVAA